MHLWSPELDQYVSAKFVEAAQVVQERAGGWEQVQRPDLLPLTTRSNPQLLKIKLVLLVDGYSPPKRSIQPDLDLLRLLGYRVKGRRETTVLVVGSVPYSEGGIVPGSTKTPPTWVVSDLKIVEELHTSAGSPCRAVATVELLEYQPGETEVRKAPARTSYKWRKGDTLSEVAKAKGVGQQAIRDANPQRKKFSDVPAGTSITIPGKP